MASHDPTFSAGNNIVSYTEVWVSKLALVIRQQNMDGRFGGFVLDAASGEPIEGADVQVYAWNWNGGAVTTGPKTRSDRNGQFAVGGIANQNNLLYVTHAGQELAANGNLYPNFADFRQIPRKEVIFFTDRSLYRPGQTIDYKGIAILVDQEGDNYKVLPNERVTVVFSDANGKEIARQTPVANDYGSFSGNFTAPRDRLMGRMMIHVDGGGLQGNTWVNVEEYKRPKFQVTLDAPKTAAKLGGEVELEGKAIAYTGAAVGGAKLRYHVVREVRYPIWWYWGFGGFGVGRIGNPSYNTGAGNRPRHGRDPGRRHVQDPVRRQAGPLGRRERRADFPVPNLGRCDRHQRRNPLRRAHDQAGYTALKASLHANDWITAGKNFEIALSTTTLDGEPQRAEGSLKIYRLKQPEKVARPDILGQRPIFRPVMRNPRLPSPAGRGIRVECAQARSRGSQHLGTGRSRRRARALDRCRRQDHLVD